MSVPATGEAGVALEFDKVGVRYQGSDPVPALVDCSFRVGTGERVALLGANGSGKTTILLTAVGLLQYQGRVTIAGEELDPRRPEQVRRHTGLLFSNPEDQLLFPRVLDDVAFTLTSRGVAEEVAYERALAALRQLGAEELAERSPARLSRGQRLRAALAGTLVSEPPILLLDEPSSGLDPAGRRLLARHLGTIGSALLVASHDIEFVQSFCNRYLLLSEGRVVAGGTDWSAVDL